MRTLTVNDVARKAKMTPNGVRWSVTKGALKAIQIPSNKGAKIWYLFRPPDVEAWLKAREVEQAAREDARVQPRNGRITEARVEEIVRRVLREAGFLVEGGRP